MKKNLIVQAYEYRAAHEAGQPWQLEYGDYVLIKTLVAKPSGPFARKEIFGFIARGANTLKIVFSGTQSRHDWLSDANIDLVAHPLGRVHQGFYKIYKQTVNDIFSAIEQNVGFELYIMGHSLGCGPAALAAVDLCRHNPHVKLYGSPRFGDVKFAENYNRLVPNTIRYVNTEDIVTTLPTPYHYCHLGREIECITKHTGDIAKNHHMELYSELFPS